MRGQYDKRHDAREIDRRSVLRPFDGDVESQRCQGRMSKCRHGLTLA
jgi:hypothetical protein